uniref:CAP domain-containing protein n=1 Tax=Strongyloides venezuelensis TaxID=75913 RepID=A0A0K0G4Y0_STRVS
MFNKNFSTPILILISLSVFLTFSTNIIDAYQESAIQPDGEYFMNQMRFYDNFHPNIRYLGSKKRAYWVPEKRERIVMDALGGNDYLF